MEGILLFDKPLNVTSYQIVENFKKLTGKKVGHGGTLDPLAQGLLVIGIGEGTKNLTKFLKNAQKIYLGEIVFGYRSSTYDKEGEIIFVSDKWPSLEEIEQSLKEFSLNYFQKPPLFSAVKIKGVPAYQLAKKEKNLNLPSKRVFLYEYQILNYSENILTLRIKVSSGFYVRSLANDLGEKLGCGAYLNFLEREKIIINDFYCQKNEFSKKEALTFQEIKGAIIEANIILKGRVQGVGFRSYARALSKLFNIKGYAQNLDDGSLKIIGQGNFNSLSLFIEKIKKGPPFSKITKSEVLIKKPGQLFSDFEIIL